MNNTFILDFETTGLNPYYDEIIEIAIKKYGSEDIYTKLTKPINKKLTAKITQITNITNEMLNKEGINIYTAFDEMLNFIISKLDDDGPIYLIAHNGTMFDFILLQNLFRNYNSINTLSDEIKKIYFRFKYIDSLSLSRYVLDNRYTYSQKALAKTYLINQENAHRAFGDVIVLEQIFNKLCENSNVKNKINSFNIEGIYNLLYKFI